MTRNDGRGGSLQEGFGLLEAIVALTILAGTGAALFTWMAGNLRAVSQYSESRARATLQLQSLELLEAINPAVKPSGTRKIGQLELTWRSELVAPLRIGVPRGEAVRWQIGLYRVYLRVKDVDAGIETQFDTLHSGLLPIGDSPTAAEDRP